VSTVGVISGVLWSIVVGLLLSAWVVSFVWPQHHHKAILLAMTGGILSAMAATMQIRTYACRLSRLIRVANGLETHGPNGDGVGLRSLR
jgi:predicted membrane protein